MKKTRAPAASAHIRLSAYPLAPARVELQLRPLAERVLGALLALAVCLGPLPWVSGALPAYAVPAVAAVAGAYLASRAWAGRYRVRSFTGVCPRCGRHLRIQAGTRIDLPHTLTCPGCRFEPSLIVEFARGTSGGGPARSGMPLPAEMPARAAPPVRHLSGDCPGAWRERWHRDDPFVECAACGARHYATEPARAAAREENARGELLERLAREGRYLK